MELGNMVFGNSRGSYPVDRGLQDRFCTFLEDLGVDGYGFPEDESKWTPAPVYGFQRGDFIVRNYCWGDCDCGYEEDACKWEDENDHELGCYRDRLNALKQKHGKFEHGYWHVPFRHEGYEKDQEALCKEMGLSYPHGCEVHCTCDYKDRWAAFTKENDHKPECAIIQPNFEHIPSGFKLQWYKYALRDSYSNEPLTKAMIKAWHASVL